MSEIMNNQMDLPFLSIEKLKQLAHGQYDRPNISLALQGLHHKTNLGLNETSGVIDFLSVYITAKCQLDCVYCLNKFRIKDSLKAERGILTKSDILHLIDDAASAGLKTIVFQGMGEPTLDENLPIYIEYSRNRDIDCILFTNIYELDKAYFQTLHALNVSLIPSIDTFDRIEYEYLTGNGSFDVFTESREALTSVYGKGRDTTSKGLTRVMISCVLTPYNIGSVQEIRKECNKQGWLLCAKSFGVKGNAELKKDELYVSDSYYKLTQLFSSRISDRLMTIETDSGKCSCGTPRGLFVNIFGETGACSDTLSYFGLNIKNHNIPEIMKAKQKYVCNLGEYRCISKALRGYGDVIKVDN